MRFDGFYALERDSLDLVFVGSSHSYCTFDPVMIDEALGVSSYQMGMPLQHPDATYFTLREIFMSQSPRTVVMEVYWDMMKNDFEGKQADALFMVMKNEELEREYVRDVYPINAKIKRFIPFVRYQKDFFAYHDKRLTDFTEGALGVTKARDIQEGTERYAERGFMFCDYVITEDKMGAGNQFNGFDGSKWVFSREQRRYMQKIVEFCRERGVVLLFITAPVANASMEKIANYEEVHRRIKEFADENGVPYMDLNMVNSKLGFLENGDFRDDAHLNYGGVQKSADIFIPWIEANMAQ